MAGTGFLSCGRDPRRTVRWAVIAVPAALALYLVALPPAPNVWAQTGQSAEDGVLQTSPADPDIEHLDRTQGPESSANPSNTSLETDVPAGDSPTSLSVLEGRIRELTEQIEALGQELYSLQERYFGGDTPLSND